VFCSAPVPSLQSNAKGIAIPLQVRHSYQWTASLAMKTARKRVLFLMPSLVGGGAERMMVTLLQHLDRSRFELHLALIEAVGPYLKDVPADALPGPRPQGAAGPLCLPRYHWASVGAASARGALGLPLACSPNGSFLFPVPYFLFPTLQCPHACPTLRHELSLPREFRVAKEPVIVACNLPRHHLKHSRH
jgi:hypothetical protein